MRFEGKTVVITGGSSGIGLLCGKCFAAEGANVVLTGRNAERLNEAVETIRAAGGEVMGVCSDVGKFDQAAHVCEEAYRVYGSIDILINSAGGASSRIFGCQKPYWEYPVEYIDWGINTNLMGPLYFSHEAMRYMAKQKSGVIILIGSIAGEEGNACPVDYSAAKSALMSGVLKSLAQNGAEIGVRVNTISPGPVLTREVMGKVRTLVGRAAETQEIVDLILYVCSDKGAFITCANYMIDGGRTCLPVAP